MRKASYLAILALVIVAALGVMAAAAAAEPSFNSVCSTCHSGAGVTVAATQTASDASTTTYSVAVTGGTGAVDWAVYRGPVKVAEGSGATGSFTVNDDCAYTVYAVNFNGKTTDGLGTTTVSPKSSVAKPTQDGTDTTAPVTTSDVAQSYTGQAVISLSATDAKAGTDTGCWGVQYLYYRIDPGAAANGNPADGGASQVTAFTSPLFTGTCQVTIAGPAEGSGQTATHTIEYWSQDAAGNVENATTKTFTITATRTATQMTVSATKSIKLHKTVAIKGALSPASLAGNSVTVVVQRKHNGEWRNAKVVTRTTAATTGAYSYKYKPSVKGSYRVQAKIGQTSKHTGFKTAWRSFKVK